MENREIENRKLKTTFETKLSKVVKQKKIKYHEYNIYNYPTKEMKNRVANNRKNQPYRVTKFFKAHGAKNYIKMTRKEAKEWQDKNTNE